jgi:gliding motility-associated-like protein
MKKLIASILFIMTAYAATAEHTKGGWMYYSYLGPGSTPNSARYKITLKIYTKCILDNLAQFCPTVVMSIFKSNNTLLKKVVVPYTSSLNINNCNLPECHPCISLTPSICYKITTYELIEELPITANGYTIAYQRCCRISGIINLAQPTEVVGDTWTVNIPGNAESDLAPTNSSAIFDQNDTAIICRENYFTYNFSAIDPNNDSLSYAFTNAFSGTPDGITGGSCANEFALPPPYSSADYQTPYSGAEPMGKQVKINPVTGIVSGVAPAASGIYALTVTVTEYIRGTTIKRGEVRKSLLIEVADCITTKALLDPEYVNCKDLTVSAKNNTSGYSILSYYWDFGDPASGANNISNLQFPVHTYSAPGDYILKLVVNRGYFCSDSTTAKVKVYPVFDAGFTMGNLCKNIPVQFSDISTTTIGNVNFWHWNFGDFNAVNNNNISTTPTPVHTYSQASDYSVELIVATNKGCRDTLTKIVQIKNPPDLQLTKDTLICAIDTLQLNAAGTGNFLWSPNYNISNVNISNPLVSPDISTTYSLTLIDQFGCSNTGAVKISVVDKVTQSGNYDTIICRSDAVVLRLKSDALQFKWLPNDGTLNDNAVKNPVATPLQNTVYHVTGSIGKCSAQNDIRITTIPYPNANAGIDQTICIGASVQLKASGGSSYIWTPVSFLNKNTIADPVAIRPSGNIKYIVTVTDTLGCPKAAKDTVLITVANIIADAGPRDTAVVLGQPLQLIATGSTNYLWSPPQWLNNIGIANPVALPQNDVEYIVKVSNDVGCFNIDSIRVHVFKLEAGLYIPNAFTPNGDGLNDVFRPVALGMQSLDKFMVYNRFGQLLYSSTNTKSGWDGSFAGKKQEAGTYIWYAEGIDYLQHKIIKKGFVVLVR